MDNTLKGILITVAVVLGLVVFLQFSVPISFNNTAADQEVLVVQVKDDCISQRNEGIKTIIQVASVDNNTKSFLINLIAHPTAQNASQVNTAYSSLVNGDPTSFMFLMGNMGKTNFTITAENLQREISSQRASMVTCAYRLNGAKAALANTLGMDASHRVVKFPQTLLHLSYPSLLNDPTLTDTDNDGRLTVFDYRAPVDIKVSASFGTGVDNENINLYPTP